MKNITAVLLLVTATAQAQIVIEQRTIEVPKNENWIMLPTNGCIDYFSTWDRKKYGGQYQCLEHVPAHVRARVDGPKPLRALSVTQQVVIPTGSNTSPLPGQTVEQRRQMDQMSR
jgi:hypothetical protein